MNISTAKVISEKREYPAGALRYVREGATNGEWSVYASSVNCERKPESAELYIFGAEYFRIYIGGKFCTEYSIRSYIFRRAYEVLDVTDYLSEGNNDIIVVACETGEEKRSGFSLELSTDGEFAPLSWRARAYKAVIPPMTYTLSNYIEYFDSSLDDALSPAADVRWGGVRTAEAVSEPFTELVQSRQKAQTRTVYSPHAVVAAEAFSDEKGYETDLCGDGNYCIFASNISCTDDCNITIREIGAMGICIDGGEIKSDEEILLSAGTHFITVLSQWTVSVRICGEGFDIASPIGGKWAVCRVAKAKSGMVYPWNEPKKEDIVPDEALKILHTKDFESLPETRIVANTAPFSLLSRVKMRKYISVPDGFCDEKLAAASPREVASEPRGIVNPDGAHL